MRLARLCIFAAAALSVALALAGCASTPPLPPVPQVECAVLVDLVADLDDPVKEQANTGDGPFGFPAGPHMDPVASGPPGAADLGSCVTLNQIVRDHKRGYVAAVRDLRPDGPVVTFSRVSFDPAHSTAAVRYAFAYGPLAMQVWSLTLRRDGEGRWKLVQWKLDLES